MNKKISIIIPTYNSSDTIAKSFESIKKQKYPKNLIEVLVIDGGSKDKTLIIAKKYGYKVFNNTKKQQEYGKAIGFEKAVGDVVMFLDSDEVLEEENALREGVNALIKNRLMVVLATGYKRPANSSLVNDYINLFSDPFAHFMYGTSSESKTKIESWKKKYKKFSKKGNLVIFYFSSKNTLPLIDMAGGTMINKDKIMTNFKKDVSKETFITKLFYLVNTKDKRVGILNNSPIIHNSVDSYSKFLNKIKWRVRVNTHFKNIPGTGFSNREEYQPLTFRLKKYLFIPYALTIIIPLIESIYYSIKYKNPSLLVHLLITVFTAFVIIYEYLLLLVNIKPNLSTYGKD